MNPDIETYPVTRRSLVISIVIITVVMVVIITTVIVVMIMPLRSYNDHRCPVVVTMHIIGHRDPGYG